MSRIGSVTGKRISRSHTTVIGLAEDLVKMLDQSKLITKVSLGVIRGRCSCRAKRVIMVRDQYGLCITVLHPPFRQDFYVSASDREKVIEHIQAWCKTRLIECILRKHTQ